MLSNENMRAEAKKYLIEINEEERSIAITKGRHSNWISISVTRAIEWVNAGIEDLEGKSKKQMLEILNGWIYSPA